MKQKKTVLQRLAFKIAEDVAKLIDDFAERDEVVSAEELYRVVYAVLPFEVEEAATEQERIDEMLSQSPTNPAVARGPSLIQQLRQAVHATPEMSIKTTIEAAIAAINERDYMAKKERHCCTGMWCEECDGINQ